jgi:hypothetical protein
MPAPFTTPVAISVPFEPNRDPAFGGGPSGLQSTNVQDAIEEAKRDALNNDRFVAFPSYGGNSNVGRYLEVWPGQASDSSPIFFSVAARLLGVTLQTTAANATCNVGIFDLNVSSTVPIYTVVMTAQKRVEYIGAPNLALISAGALIAIRVTSGSINTPTMQLTISSFT